MGTWDQTQKQASSPAELSHHPKENFGILILYDAIPLKVFIISTRFPVGTLDEVSEAGHLQIGGF